MSKKHFYRNANQILADLEMITENEHSNCIKYIIKELKRGNWSNAYYWCMTEADKIRYTVFDKVFVKYKVYKTLEQSIKYNKYRQRYFYTRYLK